MSVNQEIDRSDKSYGVAVALCMIFGIVGIHHFYIGNVVHGFIDLGLFVVGFSLILFSGNPEVMFLGAMLILADVIHTFVVTILLLIGKVKDGEGRLVAYPGQR